MTSNGWNILAIIVAIIGALSLLAAWFASANPNNQPLFGQTRTNFYYNAIALFLLALVIWCGSSVAAVSHIRHLRLNV